MIVAKSPQAREGGASIGDRLALDDSATDGHTIWKNQPRSRW